MNLKQAMKEAKRTGKPQKVTEPLAEPTETKVTVNMRMDLALLQKLKDEAAFKGMPYQTLIHSILTLHTRNIPLEVRVETLEKKVSGRAG